MKPIVQAEYEFKDLPNVFEKVKLLHGRGKRVINVQS